MLGKEELAFELVAFN
jgi:hypothetical protein